jgi:PST family polysaccharide transporter
LINQQTEIGLLFAIPGVMITLVFSPLIVELAYSSKFAEASDLVPWFMIGVLGRVISWPLGFVQLAKRSVWWFFGTETAFVMLNLMCTYGAIPRFGVRGVAYANAVCYVVYIFVMRFAAGRMIGFSWQRSSQWVLVRGLTFVLVLIAAGYVLQDGWLKNSVNLMVCGLGLVWVVFELSSRLGGGRLEFFRRLNILRKGES